MKRKKNKKRKKEKIKENGKQVQQPLEEFIIATKRENRGGEKAILECIFFCMRGWNKNQRKSKNGGEEATGGERPDCRPSEEPRATIHSSNGGSINQRNFGRA